ncbi:w, partial [Symbiodinium sp. KB8]
QVGGVIPIALSWKDISLTVDNKAAQGQGLCSAKNPDITPTVKILFDNNGVVYPGEMVAIMGASGAGKTSLLNVVSRRNEKNDGSVTVNGKAVDTSVFNRITAFVQQEDLFLGSLTVREHLRYQAQLRMDQTIPDEEKFEFVDKLIAALRLKKCQNNVIGSLSSGLSRGISGGERKRLSFASEIITNPSVLFADEPTSGLDSDMAYQVVKMMKALAASGRTVISTIHQPSSETYSLFDKLLLMWHGRTVYYGSRDGAVEYFAQFGPKYTCPEFTNPADFFIKMLAVQPGDERYEEVLAIAKGWEDSESAKAHAARPAPTMGSAKAPSAGQVAPAADAEDGKGTGVEVHGADAGRFSELTAQDVEHFRVNWCRQFTVLFSRALTNTLRDPILTKARLGQTLFLGLLAGLIYLRLENNQQIVQNVNGAMFFVLINQSFSGIFGVMQTFPMERPIFMREHESGCYTVSAYYLAKTCADFAFQLIFPAIFCTLVFWMVGLSDNDSAVEWLAFTGIILLASNTAISLGYLVSTAVPSVDVALAVGPAIVLPFLLFGGLFINLSSIPDWLAWLEYLSWFRYAYNLLATVIWSDRTIDCPGNAIPGSEQCPFVSGDQVLNIYFPERDTTVDLVVLCSMVFIYRFIAFSALWLRTRGKQNE